MRKPVFASESNKETDQSMYQQNLISIFLFASMIVYAKYLYFPYLKLDSAAVQTGLSLTWWRIPKTSFLTTELIQSSSMIEVTFKHCLSGVAQ